MRDRAMRRRRAAAPIREGESPDEQKTLVGVSRLFPLAIVLAASCLGIGGAGCEDSTSAISTRPEPELDALEDRFSYAVGVKVGRDLARSDHPVDPDLMRRGLDDALAGHPALDEGEVDAALEDYGRMRTERLEHARAQYAEESREYTRRFLEENGAREGVVVLESGLQYEVIRAGEGSSPTVNDFVTCHYRGVLPDGRVFDDTFAGGEPRTFNVASVVDGLEQGLQLMQPGARWKIYLPPELAYGESGLGRDIPPHAALVFEVELIAVEGETPPVRG